MDSESRTVYVKRFINSEADLPKHEDFLGKLCIFHEKYTDKTRHEEGYSSTWNEYFMREVDWYMEPVEMPTEEEQIIYFNNHSAAIEIKPSGLKLPLMTRSEVLKFANWLLSRLK